MNANRGLVVALGVVVLAAVIVANLSSSWRVEVRDPKSPTGVVQAYLTAVFDHRGTAAVALLDGTNACSAANLDQVYYDQSSRVDLVDERIDSGTATVHVRIEHANGDPFGGSWTEDQFFSLVQVNGSWRITGNPWPTWACPGVVKK